MLKKEHMWIGLAVVMVIIAIYFIYTIKEGDSYIPIIAAAFVTLGSVYMFTKQQGDKETKGADEEIIGYGDDVNNIDILGEM